MQPLLESTTISTLTLLEHQLEVLCVTLIRANIGLEQYCLPLTNTLAYYAIGKQDKKFYTIVPRDEKEREREREDIKM